MNLIYLDEKRAPCGALEKGAGRLREERG